MKEPLISVIVPIYKVELYIRPCLDSILAQTYKNLEIILVDDGSPDGCPAICDEYARQDSRVQVIHKSNGGLSDARNAGIGCASGEYICFVDSDDWVATDMVEYLFRGVKEYDADISTCEHYNVYKKKMIAVRRDNDRIFDGLDGLGALLRLKIGNYAWGKLYKKELWGVIRYPQGKLYEDVRTTYKIFQKCKRVAALKDCKYYYRQNDFGIVHASSIRNKISCVESRMERYDLIYQDWEEATSFLIREIFNYTVALRKTICSAAFEEFQREQEDLKPVIQFLARHRQEFFEEYQWGALGRSMFNAMCRGKYSDWKTSLLLSNIISRKEKLRQTTFIKKIRQIRESIAKDVLLRKYYKYFSTLPLQESTALIESRGGEDLAGNMFYIAQELCIRGFDVYISVKEKFIPKVKKILECGRFNGIHLVYKGSEEYYWIFSTAKYLFNDMVYNDLIMKKDGQIWTNTWHGTPLKYLEFDVENQRHALGGAARELMRTDFLAVPSQYMLDKLVGSARVNHLCRSTKALFSGYPRNQNFFQNTAQHTLKKVMRLEDTEVYVYMPTWRGTLADHATIQGEYSINNILSFFDTHLKDNQVLFVKLHNYMHTVISFDAYQKIFPFPDGYEPYAFLNIADCLITDYSSVFFDFANTRRKIVLFAYDKEEYLRQRGVYIPLESLPYPIVYTYEELLTQLNLAIDYDDVNFIKQFCTYDCENSVQKLLDHVTGKLQVCQSENICTNGKKNILLYDARFFIRNYKPARAEKALENLENQQEVNYYYGYPQWNVKQCPLYLQKLPDGLRPYSLTAAPVFTKSERWFIRLFRKIPKSVICREINREMYGMPFDQIEVIEPNAYDPFKGILEAFRR